MENERTGSHVVMAADAATEKTSGPEEALGAAGLHPAALRATTAAVAVTSTVRAGCGNESANRDSLKKGGKCDESN